MSGITPHSPFDYTERSEQSLSVNRSDSKKTKDGGDRIDNRLMFDILNELKSFASKEASQEALSKKHKIKLRYSDSEVEKIDFLLINLGIVSKKSANNQFSFLLLKAIQNSNISFAKRILLAADLKVMQNDTLFLMNAIEREDLAFVQLLLDHDFRSDLEIYNTLIPSPLYYAVYIKNIAISEMLIHKHQENLQHPEDFQPPLASMEANINISNKDGHTPLIIAVRNDELEIAELLLENEANINHQNKNGNTPLHIACTFHDNIGMVELFFDYKDLDPNITNDEGNTPLMTAILQNHIEIANDLILNDLVDHLVINKDGDSAMTLAKTSLPIEVYKKLKIHMPQANLQAKEIILRKVLAHVSDIDGLSEINYRTSILDPATVDVSGWSSSYFFHYLAKRTLELGRLSPHISFELMKSLVETAEISSNESLEELYSRWKAGKSIYLDAGLNDHTIGMYVRGKEMVWCNRWKENAYHAFQFDPSLLTIQTFKTLAYKKSNERGYLHYLSIELPTMLKGIELPFHKELYQHRLSMQKAQNCTWVNIYSLQLVDCIFHALESCPNSEIQNSAEQSKALIEHETLLCDNILSYSQCYPVLKALKKITAKSSLYEPDYDLIAGAFTACYPYSKLNMDFAVIRKWEEAKKLYLKCMPSLYVDKYMKIQRKQDMIQQKINDTNNLLKRLREDEHAFEEVEKEKSRKKQKK